MGVDLHIDNAILEGRIDVVKKFLKVGFDARALSPFVVRQAIARGHVEVVRLLLENGLDARVFFKPEEIGEDLEDFRKRMRSWDFEQYGLTEQQLVDVFNLYQIELIHKI